MSIAGSSIADDNRVIYESMGLFCGELVPDSFPWVVLTTKLMISFYLECACLEVMFEFE